MKRFQTPARKNRDAEAEYAFVDPDSALAQAINKPSRGSGQNKRRNHQSGAGIKQWREPPSVRVEWILLDRHNKTMAGTKEGSPLGTPYPAAGLMVPVFITETIIIVGVTHDRSEQGNHRA
jgi:hypothetical protein